MTGKIVQNAQALRFVAASLVLIGHAQENAIDFGVSARLWMPLPWTFGVDIFFVISGFVMFLTFGDNFGQAGASRAFLTRRAIRIVPIYWIFTTLALIAAALELVENADLTVGSIVASYLFIPWPRGAGGDLLPVLGLGWTLNYEMFFYLLFALALALPKRVGVAGLAGIFVLLAIAHPFVPSHLFVARFWSDPIILEFLAGIGLAALYRRGFRLTAWVAVPLLIAAFVLPPLVTNWRFLAWGLPATLVVACAVLQPELPEGRAHRWVGLLGGASYVLYLSHPFTVNAMGWAWRWLGLDMPILFVVLACIASIAASLLFHLWIEAPMTARLRMVAGAQRPAQNRPNR